MSTKILNYTVIQSGYAVFGVGASRREALADAVEFMEDVETIDDAESLCVSRPNDGEFYILDRDSDPESFDSYMKNQGGFRLTDNGWVWDR